MTTTFRPEYTTLSPAITLGNLASLHSRGCEEVDNVTTPEEDAMVQLKFKTGTGTDATSKIDVYAWGSLDSSTYPDLVDGSDQLIEPATFTSMKFLFSKACVTASTTYYTGVHSVCAMAGWLYLPPYWGIVVQNYSVSTLSSTAGDHALILRGVHHVAVTT
jgi:hypothetical protein